MDRKIRRKLANQAADPHVLDNGGIHAGRDDSVQVLLGLCELVFEDERIESHITLYSAPVQKLHQPGKLGFREIVRPHPCVEPVQAEVNGVCAVLDRGAGTLPIARRSQQLGQSGGSRLFLRVK